jgi:hypothetical protein
VISIEILPDDVILATFDFYVDKYRHSKQEIEAWQSLVHVCRRWRCLVFGSPRRLNLRLGCTARTPVRDTLDVWPPFPIVIRDDTSLTEGSDNIVAALERRNRVDEIDLWRANSLALEKVLAVMQEPFPELRFLQLSSYNKSSPIHSWVDLPHVSKSSSWVAFYFQVYRNFCLPLTFLFFIF